MIYLDTREAAERLMANGIDSDLASIRKLGADGELTAHKLENNHTVVTEKSVDNYIKAHKPKNTSVKNSKKQIIRRYFRHLSLKLKRPAKYPYTATFFLLIPIVMIAGLIYFVIGSQATTSALPVMIGIALVAYIFTLLLVFVLEDLSGTSVKWQGVTASGASAVFFGLLSVFTFVYWKHAPVYAQIKKIEGQLDAEKLTVVKKENEYSAEIRKRTKAERDAVVADGKALAIENNYLALVNKLPSVLSHEKIEIPMKLKLKLTCLGVDSPKTFYYSRRDFNAPDNDWHTSEYATNEAVIPMEDSKAEFLLHKNKSILSGALAQVYIDSSTLLNPNVTVSIAGKNGLCFDANEKEKISVAFVESVLTEVGESGSYKNAENISKIDLLAQNIDSIEEELLREEIYLFLLNNGARIVSPSSEAALYLLATVRDGWYGDDLGRDIGLLRDSAHSNQLLSMVFENNRRLGLNCKPAPIGGNIPSWLKYSECLESINYSQYNHQKFSSVIADGLLNLAESRLVLSLLGENKDQQYEDETLSYFNTSISLYEQWKKESSGDDSGLAFTPRLSDAIFGAAVYEFLAGRSAAAKVLLDKIRLSDDRAIDMGNYNSIARGVHESVSPVDLKSMLLTKLDMDIPSRSDRVNVVLGILGEVKGPIPQIIFFNQKKSLDDAIEYKLRIIDSMVSDQKEIVERFSFFGEAASYSIIETPLSDGMIGFNVVLKSNVHFDGFTFDAACLIRRNWLDTKYEVVEVKGATTTECEV